MGGKQKNQKKNQTAPGVKFSGRRHGDQITLQFRNGMTFVTTSKTPIVRRIRDEA